MGSTGRRRPCGEIDAAVLAETRDRLAGLRIERDHLRERGQDDDALVVAVAPIGDAAVQPAEIGGHAEAVLVDLWDRTPIWSRRWRRRWPRPATARSRCRARRRPSAASIHWRSSGRSAGLAAWIAMSGDFQRQATRRLLALSCRSASAANSARRHRCRHRPAIRLPRALSRIPAARRGWFGRGGRVDDRERRMR